MQVRKTKRGTQGKYEGSMQTMKNGQRNRMKRMGIAIVCVGMVGSGGLVQAMNTAKPVKYVNPSVKPLKTGTITPVMTTMIRVAASKMLKVPLGVFDKTREVNLPDFEIGKTEVTGALWSKVYNWAIMKGYTFEYEGTNVGTGKPVTRVSWYDVIVWTNAYSEIEGLVPVYRGGNEQSTQKCELECIVSGEGGKV
jgi:hypothetical protein